MTYVPKHTYKVYPYIFFHTLYIKYKSKLADKGITGAGE